ncbi:MAG: hypothetical protein C0408_11690, partial [Odoribacter sp.]|nr:hypothetical protein [Odoribacter sp.]
LKLKYIYVTVSIIILLLFSIYLFSTLSDENGKIEPLAHTAFQLLKESVGKEPPVVTDRRMTGEPELPTIQSIKFIPEQPTILDDIRAGIKTVYNGEASISYGCSWEINGSIIKDVKEDVLPKGIFKKGDKISVTVTPYAKGLKGEPYKSMFIVIHSAPPTLELKEMVQRLDNIIEFQLFSKDPDGDEITFSLEEPVIEGMTINKETGKIVWKPENKETGTYTFRASATDTDGTKTTRKFEFKIDK